MLAEARSSYLGESQEPMSSVVEKVLIKGQRLIGGC